MRGLTQKFGEAEFEVRVASSGQVVTAIGITRHIPGRHREHAANEPVRLAKDDRYQRDAAEIEAPKPVTAPSFVVSPASDRLRVAVAAQKRRNAV